MILRKQASNDHLHLIVHLQLDNESFRWRCAWGSHPFPSRTRWLRPKRPMVLCWRRHGRAGGCQIIWGCSSVGRAPALQAGGQEFESLHLHLIIQRAAAGLAGKLFRACSNKAGQTSQTGYSKNILNEENLFSECSGCGVVRNTENLVRFTV